MGGAVIMMGMRTLIKRLVTIGAMAIGMLGAAESDALAEPVRILIAAGNKNGLPAERPLKFADNDAKRVRDVMVSLGGVRSEHAIFLNEPTRAELLHAFDKAKAEAQRHRAEEVTLVFYFSGHGDREALHLGSERVMVSELSAKLGEVPAGLRIAVTDACRATRDKGFAVDEPFAISATMIPQATGQVWLHASSDGEAAQESDELQGAIFTHAWLSGLRGAADANGDARVTLDESFAFAHSQTLIRSSKSSGVMQKPEAVVSLREHAPVVLTQTAAKMGTIALPQGRDTHFLVYSAGAKSVLSELWGSPDRRLMLRVPPGRYVIQKRIGGTGGVAQIAILEGEERKVEEKDFTASSLEAVAKKGEGEPDVAEPKPAGRPFITNQELIVGYDSGGSTRMGFVHGPRIGYALAAGKYFALTLGAAGDTSSRSLIDSRESLTNAFGRLGIEVRLPLGSRVSLRGGVGGRAGIVFQTLMTTTTTGVGGGVPASSEERTKTAFSFGPEALLGARFDLLQPGGWLFLDVTATGALPLLQEEQSLRALTVVTGALALGARF
jgi:hypothetical protein